MGTLSSSFLRNRARILGIDPKENDAFSNKTPGQNTNVSSSFAENRKRVLEAAKNQVPQRQQKKEESIAPVVTSQTQAPPQKEPSLFDKIKGAVLEKIGTIAPQLATGELGQKLDKKVSDFVVDFARSIPRSLKSVNLTATKQKEYVPGSTGGVGGTIEKTLLGDKSIKDFKGTGKEFIQGVGGDASAGEQYGFVTGAVLAGFDLLPGAHVEKNIAEKIAKEGSADVVKKILTTQVFKNAPNTVSDFLDEVSARFAKTTDKNQIEKELSIFSQASKSLIENKEVLSQFQKNVQAYRSFGGITEGKSVGEASIRDIAQVVDNPGVKVQTKLQVRGAIKTGEMPINKDGTVTLFRAGEPSAKNELTSYSYNKNIAQNFVDEAKQGGKDIPLTEINVKPEEIKAFIGKAEGEVLLKNPSLSGTKNIESSVVQIVDTATNKVEYKTIQKGQLSFFHNLIDDTKQGIAGKDIDGKIYHLTAKTPEQMNEAGAEFTGVASIEKVAKQTLPEKQAALFKAGTEDLQKNQANAELAQQERALFTKGQIGQINAIKRAARSKDFKNGDIETLRKARPDLVESVVQTVREVKDNALSDSEALDYALNLPTRAQEIAKIPDEIIAARKLTESVNVFKQGFREGKVKTRKQVQEVQSSLMQIINDSGFPLKERGKLLTLMRDTRTPEQWDKAIIKIENRLARIKARPAIKRAKQVEKLQAKREELGLNNKEGSVVENIQKGFDSGRKTRDVAEKNQKGTIGQRTRTQLIDRLTPVFDFVNKAAKQLPTESNPYRKMRLLAGVSGKVEVFLEEKIAPILKVEKNRQADLSTLMVLEREKELVGLKGLVRARNAEQIEQGLNELKAKYGEEGFKTLEESSKKLRNVSADLLDILHKEGIIDTESFDLIKKNNQSYTPMEAVEHMADSLEKGQFGTGNSFNVAKQDAVKKIGDYIGDVGDPIEALARRIPKVIALVEKNSAMRSLVTLRNKYPETYKDLIVPIKGDTIPKGMGTINLFENGKNVRYAVPDVVESAIKNLDAETSNILVGLGSIQAKILRAGATGLNIAFIPTNVIRDITDALTTELSEKGARSMVKFLTSYPEAIFSAAKKGKLYQDWLKAGGGQSTLTEQVFKKTPKTIQELSGKKNLVKTIIRTPVSLIEFANRVGEQSTRIARFKSGISRGESAQEAAFKSRDISLDFAKSGDKVKVLNQIIPFLNAGIQGSEKMLRLYKNNPVQALAATGMIYGVPTIALYQYNSQFQDFNDIPLSERQNNWIILSRDRTQEEKDAGEKIVGIKIPKGFLGRMVANTLDSSMDFLKKKDPEAFAQSALKTVSGISPVGLPYDKQTLGQTLSTILPPWLQAGVEGISNTNLYFASPIVPRSLQDVTKSEQYRATTPEVYKLIGKITGQSPLIIENTINTTTGGLGRQLALLASGDIEGGTTGQVSRRFSGIAQGEQSNKEVDKIFEKITEGKTDTLVKKREAEKIVTEFKGKSGDTIRKELISLAKKDPKLVEKVRQTIEENALGLTYKEKLINQLGVENGEKAKYVWGEIKQLKTPKEKQQYLLNLYQKKMLSQTVIEQLQYLAVEKKK